MANGNGPVATQAMSAAEFRKLLQASASTLGRYQGPELFQSFNVDLANPQTVVLPRQLNINRPLHSILVDVRFRATVTVGAYADVSVEAPQSIVQNFQLRGIHRSYGSLVPIDMTGATAFSYARCFGLTGSSSLIAVGAGALTLSPRATIPFTSPFTGAVNTHDIIVQYFLPLVPLMGDGQNVKRNQTNFLIMPDDWTDTLQFEIRFGDRSALGDPTGATVAFTAFGSATGLPQCQVHLNHGILGAYQRGMRTGVVIRNERQLTDVQSLAASQRLVGLQKRITNCVLVKSGLIETTGMTSGVQVFDTLSDAILDRTQIEVDNKPLRQNDNNRLQRFYNSQMLSTDPMEGYLPITFIEGQSPLLAFRGDGLSGGSTYELITDVVAANAANRVNYVQEQVVGGNYPELRA
jgi:hypothetical protein